MTTMLLACDVGGTKTDLALLQRSDAGLRLVRRETFRSQTHTSLDEIVRAFIRPTDPHVDAAGFGVAGPIRGGRVRTTNLPWMVDQAALARMLGLERVALLNDVEAQAWAVPHLGEGQQVSLHAGQPDAGNLAVLAAGTGLGCAALVRGDGRSRSLASEGGHADFAPSDDTEIALLRFLRERHGRVSVERVVSGPGLFAIYEFLLAHEGGEKPEGAAVAFARETDPSAAVARAAIDGDSAVAERAVMHLLGAYGSEAGNWVLRTMATGGLWLGGGVAHKLLLGPPGTPDAWRSRAHAAFMSRFLDKGRLSSLLEATPVHVIVTDEAALFGAARFALSDAGQ